MTLTTSTALAMARTIRSRPGRAYVGQPEPNAGWQVYWGLDGAREREYVGPTFDSAADAIRLSKALNEINEDALVFADGTKRGNPMAPHGTYKPWRPTPAELRQMRREAAERGEDPDLVDARWAA